MGMVELSTLEEFVLLAIPRLGEAAYGMRIRREIEERSGRDVSIAAVYAALTRLSEREFVESWTTDPRAERGGRARRHYRLLPAGAAALWESRDQTERMWQGLDEHPELERGR